MIGVNAGTSIFAGEECSPFFFSTSWETAVDVQGSRHEVQEGYRIRRFRNYAIFSGRAARHEYWYRVLFGPPRHHCGTRHRRFRLPWTGEWIDHSLVSLVLFLPDLTLGARRLHDIGRSGWWQLLALTLIGITPLLIMNCIKGTKGPNRFGPDPLANT
jgi:uncharacterized membrane protein YhaH (DUF805 family)